ncbi:hypothetical protein BDZ90DRAFT_131515 [Jaminaea rosea]|uniref:Uncharacterized protein n=1 Tax=Jaminaea rosea TaxID=1569628 RepID=A0A316UUZ1_9BASI|nr:hypothetical protein BDZ90DRAFT_131515 [Jaminaea rosea]PWN28814.1 hypothetical protein BDZ90DRAFT_131515 [Jaminaea rosea]
MNRARSQTHQFPWLTDSGEGTTGASRSPGAPDWRRILYREQSSYPDNYLPPQAWLTRRQKTRLEAPPTHLGILIALLPLVQGLNVILVFLAVFQRLEQGKLFPVVLTAQCFAALAVASLVGWLHRRRWSSQDSAHQIRSASPARASSPSLIISFGIVLLLLYALSPVLKTLTEATSGDTIYPLAFLLFALHIALADNTLPSPPSRTAKERRAVESRSQELAGQDVGKEQESRKKQRKANSSARSPTDLSSALSLNAATSASLVLASRLPSNEHVFALLFLAVLCFGLLPRVTSWLLLGYAAPRDEPRRTRAPPLLLVIWSVLFLPCLALYLALTGVGEKGSRSFLVPTTMLINVFVLLVVPAWMRSWYAKPGGPMTGLTGPCKVAKPDKREDEE